MRRAVRALVVHDGHLLVMHRNKFGEQYYTLLGGGVDLGEDLVPALMREIQEEAGIELASPQLVLVEEAGVPYGNQYIYQCQYVRGTPQLHTDSEEAKIHALGQNLYTPMWLPLSELPKVRFRSEKLKQAILQGLQHGFQQPPQIIHTA